MDYILDRYVFNNLPFEVSEETRKLWGQRALHIVGLADWACKYQDPWKIFENHTSFLFGELLFFFLAFLTFCHAWRHGTRYVLVWFGILIHALNVENLCYWIPDMDNFWQAQGILTFFGARAPLYILIGIYHMFDYTAFVMAKRLHLPWWAEGPAVGLGAVMLDMPYDIMGIKLVWWTWHDTDPNIFDRMNWVPWNSYYFHASFACSFTWLLRGSRYLLVSKEYDWRRLPREIICVFVAGMGAFWLGTIQFALLYHPLHDIYKVHTEYTTILFLSIYILIVFTADRNNRNPLARAGNKYWFDELACAIGLEYMFFMVAVLITDPLNIVSDGLHQPIGPCNETQKVQTPTGMVLEKKKYFCTTNFDEKYIDFHCIPGGALPKPTEPGQPLEWYAVCGTDYENRAEYITIIWGICILYGWIWYQVAARSGPTPIDPVKELRKRVVKTIERQDTTSLTNGKKKIDERYYEDNHGRLSTHPEPFYSDPYESPRFRGNFVTPKPASSKKNTPATLKQQQNLKQSAQKPQPSAQPQPQIQKVVVTKKVEEQEKKVLSPNSLIADTPARNLRKRRSRKY